jgi:cysteine-rich repeat protein
MRSKQVVVAIALCTLANCIESKLQQSTDLICPLSRVAFNGVCASPEEIEQCATKLEGDVCVTETSGSGWCINGSCRQIVCGNNIVEPGEACDDGGVKSGDGCNAKCSSIEVCGNHAVDDNEQCDDGNTIDRDGCQADCKFAKCGDGIVDPTEECDDGAKNSNASSLPGIRLCRPSCAWAACGDNVLDAGEACDDGNRSAVVAGTDKFDSCAPNCLSNQTCGNGYLDFHPDPSRSEECDPVGSIVGLSHDGCSSVCKRELVSWTLQPMPMPNSRNHQAMAYDAARKKMVMFGGYDAGFLNDTWEWDNALGTWTKSSPEHSPPGRQLHGMAYDASRGVVVMFGGSSPMGVLNDTWEYDGADWSKVTPQAPSPRYAFGMSYDSDRQRVIIFGGQNVSSTEAVNELWEYDGNNWRPNSTPPDQAIPQPRYGHGQAYDSFRKKLVVFAGYDSPKTANAGLRRDTWEWDPMTNTWAEMATQTAPLARYLFPMRFHASLKKTVVFGGNGYNDTWTWDGTQWSSLSLVAAPVIQSGASMEYDSLTGALMLFSGLSSGIFRLYPNGTTARWIEQRNIQIPGPRSYIQSAMSTLDGTLLLFSGYGASNDTWTWNQRDSWQRVLSPNSPPSRRHGAMVFDSKHNRYLLFGGIAGAAGSAKLSDMWSLSLADGTGWQQMPLALTPNAKAASASYYDSERDKIVLVGGILLDGRTSDETWEFDCESNAWEQVMVTGKPPANVASTMVFDSIARQGVLFLGVSSAANAVKTWLYDGRQRTWSSVPVGNDAPPYRYYASMMFDPLRQAVVVAGGSNGTSLLDDVWELRGQQWQQVQIGEHWQPRAGAAFAYDATSASSVMFGGQANFYYNDTWVQRWASPASDDETCSGVTDGDGDGLVSLADPDCWWQRTPQCPPGTSCP